MKEFIVWDKILNCFHLDNRVKLEDGFLKPIGQDYTICQHIGILDINKNKIYADCSIIKGYRGLDSFIGFYKYNKDFLNYEFIILSNCENKTFGNCILKDMKIIDTIQENKLGLIK